MPFFIIAGAVNAAIAVALGAFGAHALKERLTERYLAIWETAVQYQMFHSLGLIAIGILMSSSLFGASTQLSWAGYLLLAGIIIFSGSLYILKPVGSGHTRRHYTDWRRGLHHRLDYADCRSCKTYTVKQRTFFFRFLQKKSSAAHIRLAEDFLHSWLSRLLLVVVVVVVVVVVGCCGK